MLIPEHDVVFVGSHFPERARVLSHVDWTDIDFALYGNWKTLGSRSNLRYFMQGGIVTLAITSMVVLVGLLIRRHYSRVREMAHALERSIRWQYQELRGEPPALDPTQPTAVFLVSANRGLGLHTVGRVEALFPNHFRNLVFVSVGTVDSDSVGCAM